MIDAWCILERPATHRVIDDARDRFVIISKGGKRLRHCTVDDLEVTTTGELLELHQSEVRFDAGRVAVHYKPDGACGRDDRGLSIAEPVLAAKLQRAVPGGRRMGNKPCIRAGGMIKGYRCCCQLLVAFGLAMSCAAVVADHPQHMARVLFVSGEGAKLASHLG